MSFRNELKIPLSNSESFEVKEILLKQGLKELFPQRAIKSIYFDTSDIQMYFDSKEGVSPRKKIRIRHYPNEQIIKHFLEVKITSFEGRFKTSQELNNDEYANMINNGYFDNAYGVTYPCVIVAYKREYFILGDTRITFDSSIKYSQADNEHIQINDKNCVIEIKADINANMNYLLSLINIPLKRFSKFSNAISGLKYNSMEINF